MHRQLTVDRRSTGCRAYLPRSPPPQHRTATAPTTTAPHRHRQPPPPPPPLYHRRHRCTTANPDWHHLSPVLAQRTGLTATWPCRACWSGGPQRTDDRTTAAGGTMVLGLPASGTGRSRSADQDRTRGPVGTASFIWSLQPNELAARHVSARESCPGWLTHTCGAVGGRSFCACRSLALCITTPFCNWRWPIAKTDSTQEQNSAPHPAVGAERLADVRNNSAKFGFSSSFSITSTLCVKNGISSKQFVIYSKRFDRVPPTFEPM